MAGTLAIQRKSKFIYRSIIIPPRNNRMNIYYSSFGDVTTIRRRVYKMSVLDKKKTPKNLKIRFHVGNLD